MKNNKEIVFKFKPSKQSKLVSMAVEKAGSQRKLSKLLNIPKGTISAYLAEEYSISLGRLKELLKFLDLNMKDLSMTMGERLPKHWGQSLGGKKSRNNIGKEKIQKYMEYIRSFRKKKKYNLNLPLNPALYEFYGILMGDGCICKYTDYEKIERWDIIITGDKRYESDYYSYIKSLIKDNFGFYSYIYKYKNKNHIRLTIRCKSFVQYFIKLGFPCGKKYGNLIIPDVLLRLGWPHLKYLIRGLFDTDGCIFAKKNEGYRYPYMTVSTKSDQLIEQLQVILRGRGYPFYRNNQNLFMKGIKNVKRWMNDVGSSNSKHKFKYDYWLTHGKLPARLLAGP